MVNRNHDADEFVRNVQQQNIGAHNNIANLVENIMAHNGLNIGLHRPNFVSPLSKYVLQTELPRGYIFLSSQLLLMTLANLLANT